MLRLHVPPVVISLSAINELTHTEDAPPIAPGNGFIVTGIVVLQPVGSVYVICVIPVIIPLTTPLEEPIVATAGLPESHVPPPPSLSVVVVPGHAWAVPDIADGFVFTVTVVYAAQVTPTPNE